MLSSATKRWEDRSTTEDFRFVFFCDCCGKPMSAPRYEFHSGFKTELLATEAEQRARDLIWQKDHEAAYERANLYMLKNRVHQCELCGAGICSDCACVCDELQGGVCCEKCLQERSYHGIKIWEGE